MNSKKFLKRKENFVCLVCGVSVVGDGFTDHCPNCLFSLHIDLFPGDRKAVCKGLMEPIGLIKKNGREKIVYRCQKCGKQKLNRPAKDDNQQVLIKLSTQAVLTKS